MKQKKLVLLGGSRYLLPAIDAAHKLEVNRPLHDFRRHRLAVDGERLGENPFRTGLVRSGRGVARQRAVGGIGMQLTPDAVHSGQIHRPQGLQEVVVPVREIALRVVVPVEMSAVEKSVLPTPVAVRTDEAFDEKPAHHVMIVNAHLHRGQAPSSGCGRAPVRTAGCHTPCAP